MATCNLCLLNEYIQKLGRGVVLAPSTVIEGWLAIVDKSTGKEVARMARVPNTCVCDED